MADRRSKEERFLRQCDGEFKVKRRIQSVLDHFEIILTAQNFDQAAQHNPACVVVCEHLTWLEKLLRHMEHGHEFFYCIAAPARILKVVAIESTAMREEMANRDVGGVFGVGDPEFGKERLHRIVESEASFIS